MEGRLLFRLLTPQGERFSARCDSVRLTAKDDAEGRGGGSLSVRRGHLPAVVALEEGGPVRVTAGDRVIYTALIRGGFARVSREEVTVLTPEVIQ